MRHIANGAEGMPPSAPLGQRLWKLRGAAASIAFVALAWFRLGLCIFFLILAQRTADIVGFLEFSFFVTPHESLVARIRLDQLSVFWHRNFRIGATWKGHYACQAVERLQTVKHRRIDGFSMLEVLDDDALEQRWCYRRVPNAFRIHHDDRAVAAHAEARRLTSFYARGAEKQIFTLEELREQRIKFSPTAIGRAEFASAYEHVTGVRLHLWLLSVAHSKKIHGIKPTHTCKARCSA